MSDQDKPTARSQSKRLFALVQLAEESIALKLGVEHLPDAVSKEVRSWLGRFVDLGREMERGATLEEQRHREELERKLEAIKAKK